MGKMLLTIQHGSTIFSPPVEEGVQIEWERTGSPGKMTFTVIKPSTGELNFTEGDQVCFYYDEKPVFKGYIFTIKRTREVKISVTCYDQLRYLKNKFSYVFEKRSATEIIKALCGDFELQMGSLENTGYIIPTVAEENTTAMDIILTLLEETLTNTGRMYVFYDDFGKITLKNSVNMLSNTLIYKDSAENFDYSSSIDEETYNSIVLYYDPTSTQGKNNTTASSGSSSSSGSQAQAIINMAASQIGTAESPNGSNNVKYNTAYYGSAVSGTAYAWCCVFVWWVFRECGLASLFYGGNKTAACTTAMSWFKSRGQWHTSGYKPGDVIFFNFEDGSSSRATHVGIVESVNSNGTVTTIEGNASNRVARKTRSSGIIGCGRPAYNSSEINRNVPMLMNANDSSGDYSGGVSDVATEGNVKRDPQVFHAKDPKTIAQWGLLRYFEAVKTPAIGQQKADALLKLYNKKTRELKVTGAFGSPDVRGGTLIPVVLDLGDTKVNNYMLVEKVTHHFKPDQYTMDLTLEGAWKD